MSSLPAAIQAPRLGAANVVRAVPVRGFRGGRRQALKVAAAVQYEYATKVFPRELVKFAETEEYIYRQARAEMKREMGPLHCCSFRGMHRDGRGSGERPQMQMDGHHATSCTRRGDSQAGWSDNIIFWLSCPANQFQ